MPVPTGSRRRTSATCGRAIISLVHPSSHTPGKAYVAAKRYMQGDRTVVRANPRRGGQTLDEGENVPNGVITRYYLKSKPTKELKLVYMTASGDSIITYSDRKDKRASCSKHRKSFTRMKLPSGPVAYPRNPA